MHNVDNTKGYATSANLFWLYPARDGQPPKGVKLHILQSGGVSIQGQWKDNAGYIAFQYMFRRDKEFEESLK